MKPEENIQTIMETEKTEIAIGKETHFHDGDDTPYMSFGMRSKSNNEQVCTCLPLSALLHLHSTLAAASFAMMAEAPNNAAIVLDPERLRNVIAGAQEGHKHGIVSQDTLDMLESIAALQRMKGN